MGGGPKIQLQEITRAITKLIWSSTIIIITLFYDWIFWHIGHNSGWRCDEKGIELKTENHSQDLLHYHKQFVIASGAKYINIIKKTLSVWIYFFRFPFWNWMMHFQALIYPVLGSGEAKGVQKSFFRTDPEDELKNN